MCLVVCCPGQQTGRHSKMTMSTLPWGIPSEETLTRVHQVVARAERGRAFSYIPPPTATGKGNSTLCSVSLTQPPPCTSQCRNKWPQPWPHHTLGSNIQFCLKCWEILPQLWKYSSYSGFSISLTGLCCFEGPCLSLCKMLIFNWSDS